MKKRCKKAISMLLSLCLFVSLFTMGSNTAENIKAAEYGTLQNGALTANAEGWTIAEPFTLDNWDTFGYGFSDGYLSIWTKAEAGTFSMSQTIENVKAGAYQAKIAAVGSGMQGAPESADTLVLTLTNNTSGAEKSAKITTDGWDNWENVIATEMMEIAEGDSVTITISGDMTTNEWYALKNASFSTDSAVEAPITVQKVEGLSEDFIHGIDVSMYLSEVQSGVKYYDENGNEANMFQIFKDAGVNYVRLRLWNCPYMVDENGDYLYVDDEGNTHTAAEVTISKPVDGEERVWEEYFLADGTQVYRKGYGAGNCGIDTVTAIGKVATQYGMKVLVDFHYSDFWADPKKQSVPKAWKDMDLETKAQALYDFTEESLTTLKEAGVDVGMVQIGNEINNGLAGETDLTSIHRLLKAGSEATRAVDSNIMIAIHYTDPQSESYQYGKAQALENAEIDYDVFASSYYPFWHGTPEQLTTNLSVIAETFNKKVMVAEVSYAWTYADGDGYENMVYEGASDQTFDYPVDVEGQATAIRDTIAAVAAIGEKGIGTFYWESAWVPVNVYDAEAENAEETLEKNIAAWRKYGSGWASIYGAETDPEIKDDLNGGTWDNQAYFDFEGNVLPSINVYKWVYTGANGPLRVSTVNDCTYEMGYKETPVLPQTAEVNLNDGTIINAPVTWDVAQVEALKTANFGEYVINGTVGDFSYTTQGEEVFVAAGTWTTTCTVKITGESYVVNGSFEDNNGDGANWTLTNYHDGEDGNGVFIEKNSANAKYGAYYYTGWAGINQPIDFSLEQTISKAMPAGYYTLAAYYQGTSVGEVTADSGLYAVVTYKDGTTKEYKAEVKINNVWKDFYQALVKDIPITADVASVKVGTRVSCKAATSLAPWVVVDDIRLMRQEDLKTYTVTFKDGANVVSTQTVLAGESVKAPQLSKTGYTLSWNQSTENVSSDMTVEAVWTANQYRISYDVNGGNALINVDKVVTYDGIYGELPSAKRKGYTFAGWYTKASGGTKITADSKVVITADTTLYAQWNKVTKPSKAGKPTLKNTKKKTMKVSFKKVKGAEGYQITYSTSKKFKKKVTKSVTTSKLNKSIKKLKKGKKYYVKVRAYKTDSMGEKVYGSYGKARTITIKK